jgi:hypothetical protein
MPNDTLRYLPDAVDVKLAKHGYHPGGIVTLYPGLVDISRWPELAEKALRLDDARVPNDIILLAAQRRAATP